MAEQSGGPVLLLDHADNCASGATQDTMYVLKEALRQGLTGIAVGPVRDPEAVAQDDRGRRRRQGHADSRRQDGHAGASIAAASRCELTGVVRAITDGEYTITGPQFTGMRCYMGRTAVLDTGAAQIVVTERNQEPWDRGVFTSVGIDPRRKRFLLLKSRMYFRPVFLPIAKGMVFCDASGGLIGLDAVRLSQAAPADLPARSEFPAAHRLRRFRRRTFVNKPLDAAGIQVRTSFITTSAGAKSPAAAGASATSTTPRSAR